MLLHYEERRRSLKLQAAYIHRMEPKLKIDMRKSQKYSPLSLIEYQSLLMSGVLISLVCSQSSGPASVTKTIEILDP